jgi:hypothetical protein
MDVAGQRLQGCLAPDQRGAVSALEEMARAAMPPVEPAGVSKQEIVGGLRQRHGTNLDRHMDMIAHPAECVNHVSEPPYAILEKTLPVPPITIVQEKTPPVVPAGNEMEDRSTEVHSRLSSHEV